MSGVGVGGTAVGAGGAVAPGGSGVGVGAGAAVGVAVGAGAGAEVGVAVGSSPPQAASRPLNAKATMAPDHMTLRPSCTIRSPPGVWKLWTVASRLADAS